MSKQETFKARALAMGVELVLESVSQSDYIELGSDEEDFYYLENCRINPDYESRVLVDDCFIVVGGLAVDIDPRNPLEEWEGEGKIYFADGDQESKREYQSALGLVDDEPDLENEWVVGRARELLERCLNTTYQREFAIFSHELEGREGFDDEQVLDHIQENLDDELESWGGLAAALSSDGISWESLCKRAWVEGRENGHVGERYAVVLKKNGYDSSLSIDGMAGGDDSGGDAVWVPCEFSRPIIEANLQALLLQDRVQEVEADGQPAFQISLDAGASWMGEFPNQTEALVAERNLSRACGKGFDPSSNKAMEARVAEEYAEGVLSPYNAYVTGDVYGVLVDAFDRRTGVQIGDGAECWGFLGSEYAEPEMEGSMLSKLEFLRNNHAADGSDASKAA